ncbi:Adenine phosphoribosyltransferase-like protein [Dinothrombium tinctorium]|uniref:Adenine phosphoribosyltransferase n=1 Tax=Dinothrombium tinctorium TaxID=1965070 RepID=A0A3S3PL76_9ACAR|nr:Adenine phosphoribosyltransferase-like protein [Dinothrombium tinctorium]RWS03883.1 Adenine phosphoribosyltransferase-like protein [Dinothrombium tinctorium]RWS05000.1 Adenine phosphoribosyltransferase-like protein [Dinothrombium tinctorium]
MSSTAESRIEQIKRHVQSFENWPKNGIIFRDLFPVFREPKVLRVLIDELKEHITNAVKTVDVIVGIESRGFLFGPILALELNLPFVPIRKKGKLPGSVNKVTYALEYGEDTIEIQSESIKPGMNCVLIDDLLATGGTMNAAIKLISECNASVKECLVVIELVELDGRKNIPVAVHSLLQY